MGKEAVAAHPAAIRARNVTAAMVGRVLVTSDTKYSAGPLNGAAAPRKR